MKEMKLIDKDYDETSRNEIPGVAFMGDQMYSLKSLDELKKPLEKKVLIKIASNEEILLGTAAAHTTDFLNIAADNKIRLTLTDETEDKVPEVMLLLHKNNTDRKMSATKSREAIIKKTAGYELFTLMNGFESAGVTAKIIVISNRLGIEHVNPDGKAIRFDVYREIEDALQKFRLSSSDSPFLFFGTLQPYYQKLTDTFLKKIQ